jgi:NADPH-dependent 2,4-dienoyl-CoA reductase/sulfur reductase-like enzyme
MRHVGNILIIGGNAAGCAAAAKAARVNPNARIIILEKSNVISTGTCELPYTLSNEITDVRNLVFYTPETFAAEKKAEVRVCHEVLQIDRRNKNILVKNLRNQTDETLPYDSLIIATGSTVKQEGVLKDARFDNLFRLKNVSDAEQILSHLTKKSGGSAVILGGGYIGIEVAEALRNRGLTVSIVDVAPAPFLFAGKEISGLIVHLLDKKGISYHGNSGDYRILKDGNSITGIRVGSRTLDADLIINCTGFKPETTLAEKMKLEHGKRGGIRVTNKMLTSDPSIYAAGDCVEYKDALTGQFIFLPQATLAQKSGYVAGTNAAGGNEFMPSVLRNLSVRIFSQFFAHVGMTAEEMLPLAHRIIHFQALHTNLVKVMPGSTSNFSQIMCERSTGKILSASFLGSTEVSGFADIIAAYIHLGRHAADLAAISYNYTPALSHFTNPLAILGKKAEQFFQHKGQ